MNQLYEALKHTPWWVYAIFGYLVWLSIYSLKTRTISLAKLCILPVALGLWSTYSLVTYFRGIQDFYLWLTGIALGVVLGIALAKTIKVYPHKNTNMITITGNSSTLVLLMCIFGLKYFFGYADATQIFQAHAQEICTARIVIFAAITGIFIGRMFWWSLLYNKAENIHFQDSY